MGLAAPSAAFAASKKPAVTLLSPAGGTTAGGTTVAVGGRAFTSFGRSLVTKVMFGTKAARYHVSAHGQVICTAPAGKGTVNVIVTTTAGVSPRVAADRYTYKAPAAAPAITAFSFQGLDPAAIGAIDQSAHTIVVTVPSNTKAGDLVASFTTTGVSVTVGGVVQVSGKTSHDFASPIVYTVTAADGTTQDYTVTIAAASSARSITSFSFRDFDPAVTGTIIQELRTIAVTVPFGTTRNDLVASFTTTGASVRVGAVAQTSGHTGNDFSGPVVYTVTAADGTTRNYTVTVTVAADPAKAITAFSFDGLDPAVSGVVDEAAHTIALAVPYGTDLGDLVATFTNTGASVTVGDAAQVSGTTANDFSTPVTYTVTAADASTQDYTVTVTADTSLVLGQSYGGGVVAYLADPGDPADQQSGLIVSTDDQSRESAWALPDCRSTSVAAGTDTTLGSGSANTTRIMLQNGPGSYAASVARAYNGGGYSDWYLPSLGELYELYLNQPVFGGLSSVNYYWSSSESSATTAWVQTVYPGFEAAYGKAVAIGVRAVRSFPVDSAKAISAFTFPTSTATAIDQSAHAIAVTVPYGTDVTALKASFTTSGAVVAVGAISQTSGTTANDFSDGLTYTVTAADASTQDYTVTVTAS